MIIKRQILMFLLALSPFLLKAQEEGENLDFEKTLQFVYLAHDPIVPVNRLTECIQRYYDNAMSSDNYMVVFYLSNDTNPYIVQVNTPNDNREDLIHLIGALQSEKSHIVNPVVDLERTVELFEELKFVDPETQQVTFGSVDWFFYVNSSFWKRRYNEEYISSLCFVMDVDKFDVSSFQIKFYYAREDKINVDDLLPFGSKDYCRVKYYSYPY